MALGLLGTGWGGGLYAANGEPEKLRPNILVVLSYHVGMEWEDQMVAGLRQSLADQAELVLVQLDVKRFPQPSRGEAMVANLASKAAMASPSIVIALDDFAYQFVLQHRDRFPAGVPVLFGGVNYLEREPPAGVGGVIEALDLEGTLALVHQLRPELKRLVVVNDGTETGRANEAALAAALATSEQKWQVLRLGLGTFTETEAALAGLDPQNDAVLLLSWNLDATGQARSYEEAVRRVRATCPAPVFGVWGFYFGHGIVGGALLDGRVHGHEVGELAAKILNGELQGRLPVVTRCRTDLLVDARELKRFGFSEGRVPASAEIRFRPASFWRDHAGTLAIVGAIILLQGATICWLLVSRRRQQQAERRVRTSEADLRLTLDSIADAVIVTDEHSRVVRINPVAERLAGTTADAAQGRPLGEVLRLRSHSGEAAGPDPVAPVLAGTGHPGPGRAELDAPEGGVRVVDFSAAPVRDDAGAIRGAVVAMRDVTAQQRTEAQLRQAQKMEAIGRLVGGVAHDFNNLLLVIRGSLELAQQPGTTQEEFAGYLHEIDEAARRAAELTRQLLAFGRQQKLKMRPVDLAVLVAGMFKMLRRVLSELVTIEVRGPTSGCWARVDGGQIEQVVLNLCVNARDAMPDGGRLVLELGRVRFTTADLIAYPWARAGAYHVLTVTDSGTGMDAETLARIFEPFFSTKPVGKGTGLGLSVVQGIVQQHDGLINVYSEPGQGTTFRVYLPVIEAPDGSATPTEAALTEAAPNEGAGCTVLLAEDEPAVRRIASGVLRSHGYDVLEVADGEAACSAAALHSGPIGVAVLDVVMPRMSGPEAARHLQRLRPNLPILLCSGYPGMLPKDTVAESTWQWLAKPYPISELLRRLRELRAGRAAPPPPAS